MRYPSPLSNRTRWWIPTVLVVVAVIASTALLLSTVRLSPTPQARPVSLLTGEWEPYTGAALDGDGPVSQLVVDVFELAGYSPDVAFTTWTSAAQRVEAGSAFAAFPLVRSDARDETMMMSDSLIEFDYVLFYRADDSAGAPGSAADLGSRRVAVIEGYDYWPAFADAVADPVVFATAEEAFAALGAGDVDVVAEGLQSGRAVLESPALDIDARDVAVVASTQEWARSTESLYVAFPRRPETESVVAAFNAALSEYRQTQEYRDIARSLSGDVRTSVTLRSAAGEGVVELRDADGQAVRLAPEGTRAVVVEWPASVAGEGAISEPGLARVKVVSGPAAGAVYWVDIRDAMVEAG